MKAEEVLDRAIEQSGLGRLLDAGFSHFFDQSMPADGLRSGRGAPEIASFLPYRAYMESDGIYENINSLGWVIEINPLAGASKQIEDGLMGIFEEGIPDNVHVQISSYISPYIGEMLEGWASARIKRGGIQEEVGRRRIEYFKDHIWESGSKSGNFYFRDFRVFISVAMDKNNGAHEGTVSRLVELRDSMEAALKTLGCQSLRLEPKHLISLVKGWLNMDGNTTNPSNDYDPAQWLCYQMTRADTITRVEEHAIRQRAIGFGVPSYLKGRLSARSPMEFETETRTFQVSRFPRISSQAVMSALLGDFMQDQLRLSGAVISTLKLSYMSAERSQREAQIKAAAAQRHHQSPMKSLFPNMIRKAHEWQAVNDEVQDGARLVHYSYGVMVKSPVEDAERAERNVRSLYRNRGWELERNDCAHLPAMIAHLPMAFGDGFHKDLSRLRFTRTGLSRNMPSLAPMQGQPRGRGLPHLMLSTRLGQPLFFSPFQNEGEGNHNVTVTGASGSGKSVLMQALGADGLALGYHVMVLDDGRSFETLCKLYDGDHVVFRRDHAICMNPFSLVSREASTSSDEATTALNSIVKIIELMARGEEGCSKSEIGLLDAAVQEVWSQKGRGGSVLDVANKLSEFETRPEALSMVDGMRPYTEGTYKDYFIGQASLNSENPFTVYELSDLEPMKDLRSVIVLALLFQIQQRMKIGGRKTRKLVIIDEAWQMLGNGPAGEFIQGFARRARKEGGSLITGTQSVNDYFRSEGAQAAFENSDWRLLLRITETEADGLKESKRISLDDAGLAVLKSLRLSAGEYSELLCMGPGTQFVGRLVLDPFSSAMYSSSPDVYTHIKAEVDRGTPLLEVLRRMAR